MKTCLLYYLYIDVIIAIYVRIKNFCFFLFPFFFCHLNVQCCTYMYDVYHILVPFCLYVYCTAPDKLLSQAWGLYPQKGGGVVCIRKKPQQSCEKRNLTFMLVKHPIVCRHLQWHWISSYQEERGGIPLTDLTPPHCCTCPKTGL